MKRWVFNFAFTFAVIFWGGSGILLGYYAVEIGILLLGKTSMTRKFMSKRDARKLKRRMQTTSQTVGGILATALAYFMWNTGWRTRWMVQGSLNGLIFIISTGMTYSTFKKKYMPDSNRDVQM